MGEIQTRRCEPNSSRAAVGLGSERRTLIADKGCNGAALEADLNQVSIGLLRPTRRGDAMRAGEIFFKPVRLR